MAKKLNVRVMDILLWSENSRFPDLLSNKEQEEIRASLLKDEKRFGVRSLAEEIVKDQDLIPLERIVLLKNDENFIAYEGNRRVAAYQCIINPLLAGEFKNDFETITSGHCLDQNYEVECIVAKDYIEANRYIERKHLKGNNEKPWGQFERDNHGMRVKRSGGNADKDRIKRVNIGKLLDEVDLPVEMKKMALGPGYVTNYYRIVDSTPGYNYFGIKVSDDGEIEITSDKKDLLNKLKVFVYSLLTIKNPIEGQSWSRAFNKRNQIENYLKNLDTSVTPAIDKEIEASKTPDIFGNESIKITRNGSTIFTSTKPKEYPSLVKPGKRFLNLTDPSKKIKEVYRELQTIEVSSCPTAVSVLVRVLIEITVRRYLDLKGEKFTNDGYLIVKGQSLKRELKEKLNYIAQSCTENEVKNAMVALNEDLLTQNLNQVVHNTGYFATEKLIRDFWKNLERVFEFMVNAIIEMENVKNKKP